MAETHTVYDPFRGKPVTISSRLVDRLRGKYAVGPTLENGEPEFGWVQNKPIAIQVEAAAEIERLQADFNAMKKWALDSDATNDRLRAALRVNALRWQPNLSHDEIDAEIARIVST